MAPLGVGGVGSFGGGAGIGDPAGGGRAGSAGGAGGEGFLDVLRRYLAEANASQLEADRISEALVTGQVEDVSQAILAMQKAELSFQLVLQLRNKALEAYQEIMRLPV